MAQVSYGTITVSDLTDITDVYLEYCLALNDANAEAVSKRGTASGIAWQTGEVSWSKTYPTWVSGYQIWIRQVTEKEGLPNDYGTPYLDTAVNQINNSINQINNTFDTKLKYFWINQRNSQAYPAGTYTASGINNVPFDTEDSSTYGYNTYYGNGISLRYNAVNMATLNGSALTFYQPPTISGNTVTPGNPTMVLSGNALTFYNPTNGVTAAATLSSTGLNIVDGSITLGSTFSVNRNGELTATAGSIGGFIIDATSIHSVGKTLNNNVSGLYMDSQGQFNTGTDEYFIASWFDSTDEEWKVAIQSNLIKFGNGRLVSDVIVGVEAQALDALTSIENTNNTISGVDTITYITSGSNSIQEAEISIDKNTFLSIIQTEGEYEFTYNNGWYYNNAQINLSDYGINVTSSGTIENGDKITVQYFIEGGIYSELSDIKDTINTAIEDTNVAIEQQDAEIRATFFDEIDKLNSDIEVGNQELSDRLNEGVGNLNNRIDSLDSNITDNSTRITNLTKGFNDLSSQINETNKTIESYIDFSTDENNPSITLGGGSANPELALKLTNEELQFLDHGNPVAFITGNIMNISNAKITEQLQFGDFAFIPRSNGNLCLKYIEQESN